MLCKDGRTAGEDVTAAASGAGVEPPCYQPVILKRHAVAEPGAIRAQARLEVPQRACANGRPRDHHPGDAGGELPVGTWAVERRPGDVV